MGEKNLRALLKEWGKAGWSTEYYEFKLSWCKFKMSWLKTVRSFL